MILILFVLETSLGSVDDAATFYVDEPSETNGFNCWAKLSES